MAKALIYDCAVIGGGPGGLVAALYLKRLRRSALLVSGGEPRAARIPKIRNLIGYSKGISGHSLLRRLHRQLGSCEAPIMNGEAEVRRNGKSFEVSAAGKTVRAKKVILATGMRDLEPSISNLRELTQLGLVGYCPICDAFEHSSERIGLLVRDSKGLHKIKFMSEYSKELVIIMMKDFKIPSHYARLIREMKLKVYSQALIKVDPRPQGGVRLTFRGGLKTAVDMLYVAMGSSVTASAFAKIKKLRRTREGFLVVNSHQETSVPGLYAVGDCVHGLSQISVAIGQAAIAATDVHNKLRS